PDTRKVFPLTSITGVSLFSSFCRKELIGLISCLPHFILCAPNAARLLLFLRRRHDRKLCDLRLRVGAASGAFEKDVLMEPRSLPLAVLTRRSSAQVEILQALDLHSFKHRLQVALVGA